MTAGWSLPSPILAGGVVETVAPVTTPMTAAIPLADVPLSPAATTVATVTTIAPVAGDVLGSSPAGRSSARW